MKNKVFSIVLSLLMFFIGLLLFIDFNGVINFISYVVGVIIIGIGIFKLISYYSKKLTNKPLIFDELGFAIISIVLGILIIVLSDAFITISRFFLGGLILLTGIFRFASVLALRKFKGTFITLLIMSLLMMMLGTIIIIDEDFFDLIGLVVMIYSVCNIVDILLRNRNDKNNKVIDNVTVEAEVIEEK